jgi:glycosyltransferase involved in cell wall biosynthesis
MQTTIKYPLVSIIVPTYNRSRLLVEAINSALNQTYRQVEVIVVDDGSPDDTPAVAAQFGGRIQYICQQNAGVSAARNRGFSESKGEFVCFLDDDDVYFEDKIALQVDALLRHPDTPVANGNYYYMSQAGRLLSHNGLLPAHDAFRNLLLSNFVWMSAPLIRRDALLKVGLFNLEHSLAADLDMWLRLAGLNDFVCIQKPVGAYRLQQESMSTNAALAERDCMAVLHKAYKRLSGTPEDHETRMQSEARWRMWFGANYLNAGKIEDFQRNFKRAIECAPELFADRIFMTKRLAENALNDRVQDTHIFCKALFDNLPAELDCIHSYREEVECRIDLYRAMSEVDSGDPERGILLLKAAMESNPILQKNPALFKNMLFESAMCSRDGSAMFFERMRRSLPKDDAILRQVLDKSRSDVNVWEGYVAYQNGMYSDARANLLAGIMRRPAWLKNKGIVKALMHSILAH